MASSRDKARNARINASQMESNFSARETVAKNAKAAKVTLTIGEENKAASAIKRSIKAERERTASRGESIANRDEASAAKARIVGGITGAGAKNVSKVYRNIGNK
jgi:hypothetical protein